MPSNKVTVKIRLDVKEKTPEEQLKDFALVIGYGLVFFLLMPFVLTYAVAVGKTNPKTDFWEAWWWLVLVYLGWGVLMVSLINQIF